LCKLFTARTPAYASGLDQVESWFELITQRPVCRGSFDLVAEFKRKININQ
jgi:hypothetical protein